MTSVVQATHIAVAVARLEAWFEQQRGLDGYGGPVVHTTRHNLTYTGVGRDWRYEGIIAGYVRLWERTGEPRWLERAARAGDDLLVGQTQDSHFASSAFEHNPATAGLPHEPACDTALLLLAQALRRARRPEWRRYSDAAERNLRRFVIGQLWDEASRSFCAAPGQPLFAPESAAAIGEALFLLSDLTGDGVWAERYAVPTVRRICALQWTGGPLDGAIAQSSLRGQVADRYDPIAVARCIPTLLRAGDWSKADFYAERARRAMAFLLRWTDADGVMPSLIYRGPRVAHWPTWIAPLGELLRAAEALSAHGEHLDLVRVRTRLLDGQDPSGGIQTARGFARLSGARPGAPPDFRDLLHVAGWCDKALRALAGLVDGPLPEVETAPFETDCLFRGQSYCFRETATLVEATRGALVCYRWYKGAPWPEVAAPEFWLT